MTSVVMLFFPVFSVPFWVLYCWGGVSDMIDGPIARKMKAVSDLGARIDSVADLMFIVCSAVLILPIIELPGWIWLRVAAIGVIKTGLIVFASCREKHLTIPHSKSNKLTGFLLFCLPFALVFVEPTIPALVVYASAFFSVLEDAKIIHKQKQCM